MKTLPKGCRQDPVPWWDAEIDEAITERTRFKKIRDMPISDIPAEERQRQYQAQAAVVRQIIKAKRRATWQRFTIDHIKYTAGPKRTAAMIKLLAREPRDCPDQILSDSTGRMYAKDGEKAAAYLRLFSQVCKRELKPLARTPTGVRAHRYRAARQSSPQISRKIIKAKKILQKSVNLKLNFPL